VSADHPPAISFPRDERGSSALEFAIIAPAFIVLLIGIISVGWAMHCISSLRLAVEQSGRALQVDPSLTQDQLATMIKNELKSIGDPKVNVSMSNLPDLAGVQMAKITATYNFEISIPLLPPYEIHYTTSVSVPHSS
jgi:Flp pilus assembly protein TadG